MKSIALLGLLGLASCAAATAPTPVTTLAIGPAGELAPELAPVQPPPVVANSAGGAILPNRVTLYVGQRSLDEDDWTPLEDQTAFAIEFAHEPEDSVIGFELGLAGSADDTIVNGVDVEARTAELYAGVVKSFLRNKGAVRPYIGGGISLISAEIEASAGGQTVDDDDSSVAGYLHGGAAVHLGSAFYLGVDLRVLFGSEVSLFGFDIDADYTQLTAFLGLAF